MTSHELASVLLNGPNLPVVLVREGQINYPDPTPTLLVGKVETGHAYITDLFDRGGTSAILL